MSNVCYTGTWLDYSGYGSANRNFITALHLAGVNVTTERVTQVPERGNFGWTEDLCKQLEGRTIPYKIKIIHLTPDCYPKYMEKDKYHIGHLFWETDQLPKEWIAPCNLMNEIWTASEAQAQIFRDSGVTVPIKCFPQPIDTTFADKNNVPFKLKGFDGLIFYSIFQWIERKNPRALITNYWKTFEGKRDVCLLIKTYGVNHATPEFDLIRKDILEWKKQMNLTHYAKIFLVTRLLSTSDIFRLHETGDCFVFPTRGEGWGIPVVEAALKAKPTITIDHTGVMDFMTENEYLPCKTETQEVVLQNSNKWYVSPQHWSEINIDDLTRQMSAVYYNSSIAKAKGQAAKDLVIKKFNYHTVGTAMSNRLNEIEKSLQN